MFDFIIETTFINTNLVWKVYPSVYTVGIFLSLKIEDYGDSVAPALSSLVTRTVVVMPTPICRGWGWGWGCGGMCGGGEVGGGVCVGEG